MAPNQLYLSFKISQIRQRRFADNYSRFTQEITTLTGKSVGRGTLIRWERGQSIPRLPFLIAIAELGATSLDNMLKPSYDLSTTDVPPELLTQLSIEGLKDVPAKFFQIQNYPQKRSVTKFSRDIFNQFGYQISTTKLAYWINGEHRPNPLYLYPLAHMADISVDELLVHPYPLDLNR